MEEMEKSSRDSLSKLIHAVLEGDYGIFKKILSTFKNHKYNFEGSLQIQNLLILACKSNKIEILKYLLSREGVSIICKVNGAYYKPEDEDSTHHNIFYYSIRSGDVSLIDYLIRYWPGKYFDSHPDELEYLISSSYQEMLINKIYLSYEMKFYVESKLLDLRFFHSSPEAEVYNYKNIKGRIALLIDNITNLLKFPNVDDKYLYTAVFVAKNIHILKSILKATYKVFPWVEIEFCLNFFISSHLENQEIHLFFKHILTTSRMQYHLKNVLNKLGELNLTINSRNLPDICKLPEENRDKIVDKIINNFPPFKDLYKDYQLIRDVYSLRLIKDAIELVLTVDPSSREGQLVIFRTLQILGENLKYCVETPKLSLMTVDLILLSLPLSLRNIVLKLRNASTPAVFLTTRLEIENRCEDFSSIQGDLQNLSEVVSNLLLKRKKDTLWEICSEISQLTDFTSLKEILLTVENLSLKEDGSSLFQILEHNRVNNLFIELERKLSFENKPKPTLLNQMKCMLQNNVHKNNYNSEESFVNHLSKFLNLAIAYKFNQCSEQFYKKLKSHTEFLLNMLSCDWGFTKLCFVRKHIMDLLVFLKFEVEDKDVFKIICELFSCIGMEDYQRKSVHELLEEITGRKLFISVNNFCNYYFKTNFNLISEELKDLLHRNGIKSKFNYSFSLNLSNKNLLACINLLLIDLMSLTHSQGSLVNNLLSLDDSPFILTGQTLHQLLAHCDNLLDVLMNNSDQAFSIFLNAIAYANGTSNLCRRNHLLWESSFKPKSLFDKDICTINNKITLFLSLEEGDLASVKIAVKNGADYFARDFHHWTCFHFAAKAPNSNATEYILSQNAKVDFKNKLNQSPLHIAAALGRTDTVSLLLKQGLYINAEDVEGKTPMHLASLNGHTETVSILIDNKADFKHDDNFGNTPLHCAIKNNHLDVAMLLLKYKLYPDIDFKNRLFTCLHLASEKGLLDLVRHLVYKGANVNARAADGSVALHSAATNGYLDIVKLLIMKGTNINSKSLNGFTPLHNAAAADNCDVVNMLLKNKAEVNSITQCNATPLLAASELGCNNVVRLLLKCGGDAEKMSIHRLNPLLVATLNNHKNVVESLVLHKVNVNVKAAENYTALHMAARNGSNDVALILVNHKALVNARTKSEGLTPLHIAAAFGKINVIETLIDYGADLNVQDNNGNTPLHVALVGGHDGVVSELLKKKANVGILNKESISPLHLAVAVGSKESVVLLLENIPSEFLNTSIDMSVLHYASYLGHIDVVETLLKHGAKVNDLNKDGQSPLYLAVEGGNKNIVDVLIAHGASFESSEHNIKMLVSSVKNNYKEILEMLLSKGIDISEIGPDALLTAIIIGYKDIVEVLLNNQVNPNASISIERDLQLDNLICYEMFDFLLMNIRRLFLNNEEIMKPLHMACAKGRKEIVEILLAKGANPNFILSHLGSPLHVAAYFGFADVVQVLVHNGGEINSRNIENITPFILAVSQGHLSVVEVLLKHKEININCSDSDGWTPLHFASQAGNLSIISLLIEKGGDIQAKSHEGSTPVHIASKYGHKHIVDLFLSQGMSGEELDADGCTLLHYAAKNGQLNVIEYLVGKQANINAVDFNGCTPLHFASSFGNKYTVECLLQSGAFFDSVDCNASKPFEVTPSKDIYKLLLFTDRFFKAVKQNKYTEVVSNIKAGAFVNAMNSDSGTVVHFAAWKGYDKIIDILLEYKCSPNISGKSGYTPMHYAAKFSHFKVVLSLLINGAVFNALSDSGKTPLDMATDKRIVNLLCLITKCFLHVKNGNFNVINYLKAVKDLNIIKALMKARDKDDKNLLVAAMKHKFVRLIELEEIFLGDIISKKGMIDILIVQKRFDEALDLCYTILEGKKDLLDDFYPILLIIEMCVAKLLHLKLKYTEALELSEKIYKKMEKFLGNDYEGSLNIRYFISNILHNMGKHRESIVILENIIEKQKQLGLDEPMMETRYSLACYLVDVEKYEESLKINYELFNQRNKTEGFYDEMTLKLYENIAISLSNMSKFEEALNIYQKVNDAKVKVLGASHYQTLRSLHNMALVLIKIGKFDKALRLLKEVLVKQKAISDSYHDVFMTLANIAEVHLSQRKFIAALPFLRDAYALGVKILGPHHIQVSSIFSKIKNVKECLNFTGNDNIDDILKNIHLKLFAAASVGDHANVTNLISLGVSVDARDCEGRTPLHFGVNSGSVGVVTLLLEGGADATLTSNKGNTPLHIAVSKSNNLLIKILLKHVNDSKLNSFINCKTKASGTTALHIAAQNALIDGITSLLEHGAIYNMANREGKTPLDIAADEQVITLFRLIYQFFSLMKSGGKNIVEKLKGLEAEILKCVVNTRNIQGKTLVQLAIENNHPDLAGEILNFIKSN